MPTLEPTEDRCRSLARLPSRAARAARAAARAGAALAAYARLLQSIEARHILSSDSTGGNIPLGGLLRGASGRGRLSCACRPYKRYRVSSQRASARPRTVEFVLSIDTSRRAQADAA